MGLLDTGAKLAVAPDSLIGDALKGPGPANYSGAPLDEDTRNLIQTQTNHANMSQADMLNMNMRGVDQTGTLNQAEKDYELQARAKGGPDYNAMSDALAQKASKSYNRDLNQMQRTNRSNYAQQRSSLLQNAQKTHLTEAGLLQQQLAMRQQQQAAADASRNAALGSILGLAGTVGGMAVGGPAGGAIGSQLAGGGGGGAQAPMASQNTTSPSGIDWGGYYGQ